jgi:hypothetical protein
MLPYFGALVIEPPMSGTICSRTAILSSVTSRQRSPQISPRRKPQVSASKSPIRYGLPTDASASARSTTVLSASPSRRGCCGCLAGPARPVGAAVAAAPIVAGLGPSMRAPLGAIRAGFFPYQVSACLKMLLMATRPPVVHSMALLFGNWPQTHTARPAETASCAASSHLSLIGPDSLSPSIS